MQEESRPNLRVIQGGLSGLQEGKVELVLENQGFVARVRRILSKVTAKLDTNPNNILPPGKAF